VLTVYVYVYGAVYTARIWPWTQAMYSVEYSRGDSPGYTAVYTAMYRPCTRVHDSVHSLCGATAGSTVVWTVLTYKVVND